MEVFYKKVNGKFVEAAYYDAALMDSVPVNSAILIIHKPGSILKKHNVDLAFAPLVIGGEYMRSAMSTAMHRASTALPPTSAMTTQENNAWNKLIAIGGESFRRLSLPATNDIIDAGIDELTSHMKHILTDPVVSDAYEAFKLVVKLKLDQTHII